MTPKDDRYPVRCHECGQIIAVRHDNTVVSSLRHRSRKKEIRVRLEPGQTMTILCDKCGGRNEITGA